MRSTEQYEVHGLPVRIRNTRADIRTEQVVQRLTAALDLVATYAPRSYRRLRTDLAGFVVERFACRGAFFPMSRECLVELTFTVNPQHGLPEIAASIVHEATHARVARWCGALPPEDRPREERLCRRAELAFGLALPDGAIVVQRAQASLALNEHDVAPTVDWREAARRVAEADAAARRTL
jgi:predicted Zn-dependent protease